MSQQSSGLTRAVGPAEDDLTRARRWRWMWTLVAVVLLVGAVLSGVALWEWWHCSDGDIVPGPIPT